MVFVDYYMAPQLPREGLDECGGSWLKLYRQPFGTRLLSEPLYPVIRMWGSTPGGQKACLHVHGSMPYVYARPASTISVGPRGSLRGDFDDARALQDWTAKLHHEISVKIQNTLDFCQSSAADRGEDSRGEKDPQRNWKNTPVVYDVEVVERIPLYGFHPHALPFLKITLFDPKHVRLLSSVLQSGAIQSTEMQPYEAHISNILQFFIDNDVSGMGYIHLSDVRFRPSLPLKPLDSSTASGSCQSPAAHFSSPVPLMNEYRLWWEHSTHPSLIGPFAAEAAASATTSTPVPQQGGAAPRFEDTASQVLKDFSPSDLEISQAPSFASVPPPAPRSALPPLPEAIAAVFDEGLDASEFPDHKSRSRSSLEVDSTVWSILNSSMVSEEINPEPSNESRLNQECGVKCKPKAFRAVHSLREIWEEERERARRLGLGSQIEAPPAASPPHDVRVSEIVFKMLVGLT